MAGPARTPRPSPKLIVTLLATSSSGERAIDGNTDSVVGR